MEKNKRKEFGKYLFFDFENKWQQKESSEDIEIDLDQIENELFVQQLDGYQNLTYSGMSERGGRNVN